MSIFDDFLSSPEAQEAFASPNFIAAMLRFEAALAHAQAQTGLIPPHAGASISAACEVSRHDVARIAQAGAVAGSVAIPLVQSLKAIVERDAPEALPWVHFASTSQDVMDTAMALVTRDVLAGIKSDVRQGVQALLLLAQQHAATPMLARTLMQPASVTSFGWKCAAWAAPLERSLARLQRAEGHALCVQLGGAAGTQAGLQGKGAEIMGLVAERLGLSAPQAPWQTQRDEWVGLGCELGLLAGSLGKIAKDMALMGQFEVAELAEPSEPGRGGSSAMPHKHNPMACLVALAASARAAACGGPAGGHAAGTRTRTGWLAGRAGRVAAVAAECAGRRARHGPYAARPAGSQRAHARQYRQAGGAAARCGSGRMV